MLNYAPNKITGCIHIGIATEGNFTKYVVCCKEIECEKWCKEHAHKYVPVAPNKYNINNVNNVDLRAKNGMIVQL
jgi:hypothetical protein